MNQTLLQTRENLETLLSPILGERPEGKDLSLSYSMLYQQIKEAKRADEPALDQGAWVVPLKVADWGKVRQLCEQGLRESSKDLQLAVWYTEAMTWLEGFAGATSGLCLTGELLRNFKETLFPHDPDERVAKLEWLNSQLGAALRQVPLTSPQHGGYSWYRWKESREVGNLQRRGGDDYDVAIKEGKLSVDAFDKSAKESGVDWYQKLLGDLAEADMAREELVRVMDDCFGGDEAPGFAEVREALGDCLDVAQRLFEFCGGTSDPAALKNTQPLSEASANAQTSPGSLPRSSGFSAGSVSSRAEAIYQLREIAHYFRDNEPHSPVALLAERAAKWAEMPLESWLKAVIKDETILKQLHELLDFRPD